MKTIAAISVAAALAMVLLTTTMAKAQGADSFKVESKASIPLTISVSVPGSTDAPISSTKVLTVNLYSLFVVSGTEILSITTDVTATVDGVQMGVDVGHPATASAEVAITVAEDQPAVAASDVPTRSVRTVVASRNANLRTGPGTEYAVSGGVVSGESLAVQGQNEGGDWLLLDSGDWIATFLVDGDAADVAVVEPGAEDEATADEVVHSSSPDASECTVDLMALSHDGRSRYARQFLDIDTGWQGGDVRIALVPVGCSQSELAVEFNDAYVETAEGGEYPAELWGVEFSGIKAQPLSEYVLLADMPIPAGIPVSMIGAAPTRIDDIDVAPLLFVYPEEERPVRAVVDTSNGQFTLDLPETPLTATELIWQINARVESTDHTDMIRILEEHNPGFTFSFDGVSCEIVVTSSDASGEQQPDLGPYDYVGGLLPPGKWDDDWRYIVLEPTDSEVGWASAEIGLGDTESYEPVAGHATAYLTLYDVEANDLRVFLLPQQCWAASH